MAWSHRNKLSMQRGVYLKNHRNNLGLKNLTTKDTNVKGKSFKFSQLLYRHYSFLVKILALRVTKPKPRRSLVQE